MDDLIQEKITQKENELHAIYDEKLMNYEERLVSSLTFSLIPTLIKYSERDLHRQVSLIKNQLKDLQSSNESTEAKLLTHSQRQGQPFSPP